MAQAAKPGTGAGPLRETVADVFLESLQAAGVRFLFGNLGTDYPPIVETLAKYGAAGQPLPQMILCPHENTAITAAHGAALATGRGQGVFVHVGVGTQNMGGAVHNAWAGRIPMLIFAGRAPVDTRGLMTGGRDNPIHFYQDVRDQAGIVRQYVKWELNLEAPEQAAYAFQRAMRLMESEPRGAVYLTAGREALGAPVGELAVDPDNRYARPTLGALTDADAARLAQALRTAERPLIVTSYLGRRLEAVAALVALSEALRVPVVEAVPSYLNFPRDHAHHWGLRANPAVGEADCVLLLDTDVPWLAKHGGPAPEAPVVQLDLDPLKPHMTMWDFPVTESHQVETAVALSQMMAAAAELAPPDADWHAGRERWLAAHRLEESHPATDGPLDAAALSDLLGALLDPRTVIFDEGVSNAEPIRRFTRRTEPGTYYGIPGSSLGWGGGAALGHKLARPEREVAWLVGDGAFLFSVPSSLYLTAKRYRAPFLTVIYNNGGWGAVKIATERVYGNAGHAAATGAYLHDLDPGAALEQVAAPFGAFTARAATGGELEAALKEARAALADGRCAVIDVRLREG